MSLWQQSRNSGEDDQQFDNNHCANYASYDDTHYFLSSLPFGITHLYFYNSAYSRKVETMVNKVNSLVKAR